MKHLSLLSLLLCVSCNIKSLEYVNEAEICNQQKISSMSSKSSVSSINILSATMNSLVEVNCEDISQYKCDIREFSPSLSSEVKKGMEYCPQEGLNCVRYDHQVFDTSEQKQIDEYASAEDFEKGGQYNRKEVTCWHQFNKKRSPASEGVSIKDALKAANEICKQ